MSQRPKLELALNKKTELTLLFDEPIIGQNRYGDYYLYCVKTNGTEYSWFPTEEVHRRISHLGKDDTFTIVKTARQSGKKLLTDYEIDIPVPAKVAEILREDVVTHQVNYEGGDPQVDLSSDNCFSADHFYDIMMRSYKDALNISKELNGNANVPQIATTLFIARSKS